MYILDTDTLTHLYAGHPRVVANLRDIEDPDIVITIITKIELLRGRFEFVLKAESGAGVLRAYELLARTEDLLAHYYTGTACNPCHPQRSAFSSVSQLEDRELGGLNLIPQTPRAFAPPC